MSDQTTYCKLENGQIAEYDGCAPIKTYNSILLRSYPTVNYRYLGKGLIHSIGERKYIGRAFYHFYKKINHE